MTLDPRKLFVSLALFGSLLATETVMAKRCNFDFSSEAGRLKTAKCLAFQSNTAGLKKHGVPRKIAVGSFQIRYTLRTQEYGIVGPYWSSVQSHHLQWDDAVYQELTNLMYDSFVEKMTAEGFEVAPVEDVKNTSVYQRLKPGSDPKKNSRLVRFTPYGMKQLKMQGAMQAQRDLPGINKELGTDAVVSVFLELSLCQASKGKLFGKKDRGAYLCFSNTSGKARFFQNHPFMIQFLGGYKEGKMPGGKILYSPRWQNGVHKTHDPGIFFDQVMEVEKRSWLTGLDKMSNPDLAGFAQGAVTAFDVMIDLGITQYKAKANK